MVETSRLRNLVSEIGKRGLPTGSSPAWEVVTKHGLPIGLRAAGSTGLGVDSELVAEALPDVQAYVDDPALPDSLELPDLTNKTIALALVAGARRAANDVTAIERAAAEVARELGATVRELAATAGISERAANDRYRRVVLDPAAHTRPLQTRRPQKSSGLAGVAGVTFTDIDGRQRFATFVKHYVDNVRGDVYVVRHDDGREEEIVSADITPTRARTAD